MADNQVNVKFGADYSQLQSGVQSAASALSSAVGDMNSSTRELAEETASNTARIAESFMTLHETVKGLLELLGAGELARKMTEFVKSGAEAGENLQNIALQTGIGVEQLSRFGYAAQVSGVGLDRMTMAARELSLKLIELRSGSGGKPLSTAMADLGLSPSDLTDVNGALLKISDTINRLGVNPRTIGDISEIFGGRSGAGLIPMIANLRELESESDKVGATLSESTVAGADAAQEAMNRLNAQWDAAKTRLAAALLPAIEEITGALTKFATAVNELASNPKFIEFIDNMARGFGNLASKIAGAASGLAHFIDEHRRIGLLGGGLAEGAGGALLLGAAAAPFTGGASLLGAAALATGGAALGVGGFALRAGLTPSQATGAGRLQELLAGEGETEPLNSPLRLLSKGAGTAGGGISAPPADHSKELNKEFEDFVSEQRLEVAEAGNTAQAKIAMLQAIGAEATKLYGAQSRQARTAAAEELGERQRYIDQLKSLDVEEINSITKSRAGLLDITKSQLAQEVATRQISKLQELQQEQNLVDQKYALELNSLNQIRALYDEGSKDYGKYTDQLITKAEKWRETQIQIATQIAEAQQEAAEKVMQSWQQALEPVSAGINGVIDSLLRGESPTATLARAAGGGIESLIHGGISTLFTGGGNDTVSGALSSGIFGESGGIAGLIAGKLGVSPAGELGKAFGLSTGPESTLQTAAVTFQGAVAQFAAAVGTSTVGAGSGFTDAIAAVTGGSDLSGAGDLLDLASGGLAGTGDFGLSAAAGASAGGLGGFAGFLGPLGGLVGSAFGSSSTGSGIGSALGMALPLALSIFGFKRGGIVSAAGGALMGSDASLALLHPKEMVLPKDVTEKVLGSSGGDTHYHIQPAIHINTIDSKSFADHIQQHSDAISKAVNRGARLANSSLLRAR